MIEKKKPQIKILQRLGGNTVKCPGYKLNLGIQYDLSLKIKINYILNPI